MIFGKREETLENAKKRHIEETKIDLEGWKSELKHAKEKNNKSYKKYCHLWIEICQNTLNKLEEF